MLLVPCFQRQIIDVLAGTPPMTDRLIVAASGLDHSVLDELLRQGAQPNGRDYLGRTALTYAALRGDTDVIARLLNAGADVNVIDSGDMTPLMYAARNDHPDAVQLLMNRGANAAYRNRYGNTALDEAKMSDSHEVERLLHGDALDGMKLATEAQRTQSNFSHGWGTDSHR
jgi:ankyrin repeat protein